jgi:intracellular sulfur oxidation DsrE/DsrF family protein
MKTLYSLIGSILLLSAASAFAADKPDDGRALQGVETGKVIFDVNMTDAEKMTLYLAVIRETVDDLKRQGVKPDVILAFRGKSVLLVSKNRDQMELTDFEHLDKIAAQLADLRGEGVRMEACSVATRLFGVDNGTLVDGVEPVGNTFVSLTGYQAQGYANIPIY